jgi:hypothetical protein
MEWNGKAWNGMEMHVMESEGIKSDTQSHLSTQFVYSQSSHSLLLHGPQKKESFLVHISTITLFDVLTELNP